MMIDKYLMSGIARPEFLICRLS